MAKKIDEFQLYETLKSFECPFDWILPESNFSQLDTVQNKIQQLEDKINTESEKVTHCQFQWRKYVFCTTLSIYYFKADKKEQAWQAIEEANATINVKGIQDSFYESIKAPLFHLVLAMKGRYYFEEGDYLKSQEVINKIKRKESMSDIEKAALLGIKVSTFNEFGPDSSCVILNEVREALRLNPEEAEWHFLLGKVLRRMRKLGTFFEIPKKEEISAFENAYKKKKCSVYSVFCALAYKELASKLFQKYGMETFGEQIKALNGKALDLYREALQDEELSATALSKISRGLAELPYPFKDVNKSLELALKAVELTPTSPLTLHTLAMFYERYELDLEKSLEYNIKSFEHGSYGAGMDIIKINLRINPEYNPLPILNELKEKFSGTGHLEETTLQEACYYLIVKQDMDQALDLFLELIKNNPALHGLRMCKPMWLYLKTPISIYELLYHELKSSRNKNKSTACMEALIKIKQNVPELFEMQVDEHFLENLKEESQKNLQRFSKKKPTSAWQKDLSSDQRFNPGVTRDRLNRSDDNNWRNKRQGNNRNSQGDSRREHNNFRNHMTNRNNAFDDRFNNRRTQHSDNEGEDVKSTDRSKTVKSKTEHTGRENSWRSPNSLTVSQKKLASQKEIPPHEKSLEKSVTKTDDVENQSKNVLNESTTHQKKKRINTSLVDDVEKENKIGPCSNTIPHNTRDTIDTNITSNIQDKSDNDTIDIRKRSDSDSGSEDQSDEENYEKKFDQQKILENIKQLKDRLKGKIDSASKQTVEDIKKDRPESSTQHSNSIISNTKPQVLEKSSTSHEFIMKSISNIPDVPCDPVADEEVVEQLSQLDIQETKKELETVDQSTVEPEKKSSNETESDNEIDLLGKKLNHLNKNEIEMLLKMITKNTKKKPKKTVDDTDQEVKAEADSSLPPPKITVVTAGNTAIRQPKGPSENNFSLLRKN